MPSRRNKGGARPPPAIVNAILALLQAQPQQQMPSPRFWEQLYQKEPTAKDFFAPLQSKKTGLQKIPQVQFVHDPEAGDVVRLAQAASGGAAAAGARSATQASHSTPISDDVEQAMCRVLAREPNGTMSSAQFWIQLYKECPQARSIVAKYASKRDALKNVSSVTFIAEPGANGRVALSDPSSAAAPALPQAASKKSGSSSKKSGSGSKNNSPPAPTPQPASSQPSRGDPRPTPSNGSSDTRGSKPRGPRGYIGKVIEKGIEAMSRPTDGKRLFDQLLKDSPTDASFNLFQIVDRHGDEVLAHALAQINSSLDDPLLRLADRLCEATLTGEYVRFAGQAFATIINSPRVRFCDKARDELSQNRLKRKRTLGLFLLRANQFDGSLRTNDKLKEIIQLLTANSADEVLQELAVLFTDLAAGRTEASAEASAISSTSMGATMLPPGERGHDNDHKNFRDIEIAPTAGELADLTIPYVPYFADVQKATTQSMATATFLDRHFRILREDLVGPLKEEFGEELRRDKAARRHTYATPHLNAIKTEFGLRFVISLAAPPILGKRLQELSTNKRKDFLLEGPGRKVLGQDTLLILYNQKHASGWQGSRTPTLEDLFKGIEIVGIMIVCHRRDIATSGSFKSKPKEKGKDEGADSSASSKNSKKHRDKPNEPVFLEVQAMLPNQSNMPKVIAEAYSHLLSGVRDGKLCDYAFAAQASFFNYEPVLRALQGMAKVPFAEELVFSFANLAADSETKDSETDDEITATQRRPPLSPMTLLHDRPESSARQAVFFGMEPIRIETVRLNVTATQRRLPLPHMTLPYDQLDSSVRQAVLADASQQEALHHLTNQRVVLVQGPPGTGKTYVGVQMVRAMLQAAKEQKYKIKILCLCYTNHALDSFLESLLDANIPKTSFVRLGGGAKVSERLQERCIHQLPKRKFSGVRASQYGSLKRSLEKCQVEIDRIRDALRRHSKWTGNEREWEYVQQHLEDEGDDYEMEELSVYEQSDGWALAGSDGKAASPGFLWQRWLQGKSNVQGRSEGLWKLTLQERKAQAQRWNDDWVHNQQRRLHENLKEQETKHRTLNELRMSHRAEEIADISIIGSTTVSAAKQASILQSVKPDVVLVEEAGEILEAQILTALDRCQQLIMIGDHMQLRPKVESYRLRVDANKGYDVDRSLFERLVTQEPPSLPMTCLNIQHRMRPEISRFVRRLLYPELQDHENTRGRPRTPGVDRDVVFVNHKHGEMSDDDAAALGSNSKINEHEVAMVVQMARHVLLQQGVVHSDIVILTPYLGQLSRIRAALAEAKLQTSVGDLDQNELAQLGLADDSDTANDTPPSTRSGSPVPADEDEARASLSSQSKTKAKGRTERGDSKSNPAKGRGKDSASSKPEDEEAPAPRPPTVRVATIDNYQGEEAQYVFISLVRSNRERDIGFLNSRERVNVLLSRARRGMFIIGDLECFVQSRTQKGRNLWSTIKDELEEQQAILPYFPARCEQHNQLLAMTTAADFAQKAPVGGCQQSCMARLECGHECPERCHPGPHDQIRCRQIVEDRCPYGHPLSRECGDLRPVRCNVKVQRLCERGLHTISNRCFMGQGLPCAKCAKAISAEKDAATKAQQKQLEDVTRELQELEQLHEEKVQAAQDHAAQERLKARMARVRANVEAATAMMERGSGSKSKPSKTDAKATSSATPASQNKTLPDPATTAGTTHRDQNQPRLVLPSPINLPAPGPTDTKKTKAGETAKSTRAPAAATLDAPAEVPSVAASAMRSAGQNHGGSAGNEEQILSQVLSTYTNDPMLAHDQLEQACAKYKQGPPPLSLCVLHTLLEEELGGTGDVTELQHLVDQFVDAKADRRAATNNTSQLGTGLIFFMAAILAEAEGLGFLSLEHATIALSMLRPLREMPALWLERLERLGSEHHAASIKAPAAASPRVAPVRFRARQRWQEYERRNGQTSVAKVMQTVLGMVGLETVKNEMIDLVKRVKLDEARGNAGQPNSFNVRFEGNPGTGKTTIARHYGSFLRELKVLPAEAPFIELTASKLIHGGVDCLDTTLTDDIKPKGGGVIFVDEAYQLTSDRAGKKVLDHILPLAESLETKFGKLVWILAGYKPDMEKLFEHNIGLPSRFPHRYVFEDYSDAELLNIFKNMLTYQDAAAPSPRKVAKPSGSTPFRPAAQRMRQFNNYYPPPVGTTSVDDFGNKWTVSTNQSWYDKYSNTTVDPQSLGQGADLIAPDGDTWTYDASSKTWTASSSRVTQSHYPGSSAPAPTLTKTKRPKPFYCQNELHGRVAIRRLGRRRGVVGFGNARAVRVFFDQALSRQARRIQEEREAGLQPDLFELTQTDLLGPQPTFKELTSCPEWKELMHLHGLQPVKDTLTNLVQLVVRNFKLELEEKPLREVALNRLFLGNPGTGKTTVARLYGRILSRLGLLSKGDCIMKTASDFVGNVVGGSEEITRGILQQAEGCVLVIDEAYALAPSQNGQGTGDPYRTAVLDTIVEMVQARPGDDRAVIMLGYREQMESMLKVANPGLARRFQLENALTFPDYSDADLLKIMLAKAKSKDLRLSLSTAKVAVRQLAKARAKPNFGNAGAVDNLLSEATQRQMQRLIANPNADVSLLPIDFGVEREGPDEAKLRILFDDLIGMDGVQKKLRGLQNLLALKKRTGQPVKTIAPYNWIFTGNPGTGKTTVARRMGQMYHALGLLPSDKVSELSASDLTTGYVGQTGRATRERLVDARGGVLFVDEAYQLNPRRGGTFMQEAVDELVKCLTEPEFQSNIVVILAGYEGDMAEMMQSNQGLSSRFTEKLHFEDFTVDSVTLLLRQVLKSHDMPLCAGADERRVQEMAHELTQLPGFGNGRSVHNWVQKVEMAVANRLSSECEDAPVEATVADLRTALDEMRQQAQVPAQPSRAPTQSAADTLPFASASASAQPPVWRTRQATKTKQASAERAESPPPVDEESDSEDNNPFAGCEHKCLRVLQDYLDEAGVTDMEGARELARLRPGDARYEELIRLLINAGYSRASAEDQLAKWKGAHESLEDLQRQVKQKTQTLGQEPIWRCAVCGRADRPYIVCHVAPYIVGYRPIASQ